MLANRLRCLGLAVWLVLSHSALTVHAATHLGAGVDQCQLCLGQAQQSHSLPATIIQVPATSCLTPADETSSPDHWACEFPHAYLSRAPPAVT